MYINTDWETTLLGHYVELGCWLEVFSSLVFWISLHQGTLFILCSKIQGYLLSLMNEVDPWLLLPLCILYDMQNQIFQRSRLPKIINENFSKYLKVTNRPRHCGETQITVFAILQEFFLCQICILRLKFWWLLQILQYIISSGIFIIFSLLVSSASSMV